MQIEPLTLNLNDEQKMVDWIKTTSPDMLNQLWPNCLYKYNK